MIATIPISSDSPSTDWRAAMARRLSTGFGAVVVMAASKDGTRPAHCSPVRRRSSLTLRGLVTGQSLVAGGLRGPEIADPPPLLRAPAGLAAREVDEGDHAPQVVEL